MEKSPALKALELKLYKLEYGLGMPYDPDAIARCKAEIDAIKKLEAG